MIIPTQLCTEVMCFLQESERGVSYHQLADQFRNRSPKAAVCAAANLAGAGFVSSTDGLLRVEFDSLYRFLDERDAGDIFAVTNGIADWTEQQVSDFFYELINLPAL
jgi:hypothetical protein